MAKVIHRARRRLPGMKALTPAQLYWLEPQETERETVEEALAALAALAQASRRSASSN